MHSVAEVLRPDFARTWHEAVAIVQAAAAEVVPGAAMPDPADIALDEDGTLTFGFGSESAQEPVKALAALLVQLLEGIDKPAALYDLAVENARTPSHATVESFSKALAFFERPNRASDIRAVVGRLRGHHSKPTLDEEFQRLREKVAAKDQDTTKEKAKEAERQKPARRRPRLSRREQAIAVAALIVVVFGTLALRSGAGVGSVVGLVEGRIQAVVSAGLEGLGVSKTSETSNTPVEAATATSGEANNSNSKSPGSSPRDERARSTGTSARTDPTSSRADARVRRATQPAQANGSSSATATDSGAINPQPPVAPSRLKIPPVAPPPARAAETSAAGKPVPSAPSPVSSRIYSSSDPEVQPAVLVRPQMPREPAPGSDTGYFDIVVDEKGDVAQVKLISPRRKYHDRMMVAAAKAWKFKPAVLNGHPVKYRVRVAIILPPMPGVGGGRF